MTRDFSADVSTIISTPWDTSEGKVIPTTDNLKLAGGAKKIQATFLYADLANSSKIARDFDQRVAAKIFKSFLQCSTQLVAQCGGRVISFDGDRILGVFMDGAKNTGAAECGLKINHLVSQIIRPKFESTYEPVRNAPFKISHGVGIDTGEVLVVRGGVRGNNDLISIGRAPNFAAKMSDIRESDYKTFISTTVYNSLLDSSKYGGPQKQDMWTPATWNFLGSKVSLYKSNWRWKI